MKPLSSLLFLVLFSLGVSSACGGNDSSTGASGASAGTAGASAGQGGSLDAGAGGSTSPGGAGQGGTEQGGAEQGGSSTVGGTAGESPTAGAGQGGSAGAIAASGTVDVAACKGTDGIDESCVFRYLFDETKCSAAAPCDRLVVFWGGGEMDCSKYDVVMQAWAKAGYFSTCVQLFESSEAAGDEPYFKEAPRVDLSLRAVVELGKNVWSGKDLVLSGISHGATAPVIAMARTAIDDAAEWKGSRKTAACFFDGAYDVAATDDLSGTGDNGSPCKEPVPHSRLVGRYYSTPPLIHSCSNSKCACAPGHSPDMEQDSITQVPVSNLAVKHWRLTECGSQLPACTGDVLPSAPIEALCSAIDASPEHDCAFDSLPSVAHGKCSNLQSLAKCIDWVETLPAATP